MVNCWLGSHPTHSYLTVVIYGNYIYIVMCSKLMIFGHAKNMWQFYFHIGINHLRDVLVIVILQSITCWIMNTFNIFWQGLKLRLWLPVAGYRKETVWRRSGNDCVLWLESPIGSSCCGWGLLERYIVWNMIMRRDI